VSNPSTSKRPIFALALALGFVLVAAIALLILSYSPAYRPIAHAASSPSSVSLASQSKTLTPAARERLQATFATLPLAFEQNQGQTDRQVKYMARGNGYKLYLTSSEAIFTLHKEGTDSEVRRMMMDRRIGPSGVKRMWQRRNQKNSKGLVAAVHMQMLGANPKPRLTAEAPQSGKVNYFIGNDPSKWHPGVPLFGAVKYQSIYPGIDLAFHGNGKQLEFDYLVDPGANPKAIALEFQGANRVSTNAAGDLVLTTAAGPLTMHRPVAYQVKDGVRQNVDVRFAVSARNLTFTLGSYDRARQLVIDPTVTYSTYFGGASADYGLAISVDGSGNEYVAGATDSASIPDWSTATNSESFDVFVSKISSAGALQFTTEFGGSGDDFPGGIAIDSTGIYVSGTTDSGDFPVTSGVVQPTFVGGGAHGNNDAFAAKLTLTGSAITWATYINGSDSTSGLAVAIDGSHNVYVVGETFAPDLGGATGGVNPLPNGSAINLGSGSGDDDGYIVKLNSTGTAYLLLSYIGGSSGDLATGVALDGGGNIYVSGETISTDLPTTAGVVQPGCGTDGTCNTGANGPLDDAFIAAIQANLSNYTYLTYYGGDNVDDALAISADSTGDAFVTGLTESSDFPTAGTPYQPTLAGTQNAFAVELNPTGSAATYGTFLGGNGTDLGLGIAQDTSNPANIYITGQTSSSNFPTVNPTQAALSGPTDAFVSVLSPGQSAALFSTYLGGGGDEDQVGGGVVLDSSNNIYVTGDTDSGNGSTSVFPTTNALDGTYGGTGSCLSSVGGAVPCPDAFIAAYGPATVPDFTIVASALSPASVSPGSNATSTVTVTALNAYNNTITLTCSVSGGGSPAPTCGFSTGTTTGSGSSTLTVSTTGSSAALYHPSKFFYAMWLPIAGMSLIGMSFSSARSRRKKLFGFLMIGMVMAALFLMPACGGGSSSGGGGGGGGCTGCTPAGSYTVSVTGTGNDAATTTHSVTPPLTLTVN
jgi:hypothetical protein